LVRENVLRIDRAQHMLGLEVDPTRAVYLNEIQQAAAEAVAAVQGEPASDAAPPDEPDEDETGQKMLAAIAARLPQNGNGKHSN
jgi:hypothetical protein